MAFEQAALKVENIREFEELKGVIDRAFGPERIGTFLKRLEKQGVRARDFDAVLTVRALEVADADRAKSAKGAMALYGELVVADQAQIREFYLTRVEAADEALRHKFKKVYRYS